MFAAVYASSRAAGTPRQTAAAVAAAAARPRMVVRPTAGLSRGLRQPLRPAGQGQAAASRRLGGCMR
jgi:hypothetical protein